MAKRFVVSSESSSEDEPAEKVVLVPPVKVSKLQPKPKVTPKEPTTKKPKENTQKSPKEVTQKSPKEVTAVSKAGEGKEKVVEGSQAQVPEEDKPPPPPQPAPTGYEVNATWEELVGFSDSAEDSVDEDYYLPEASKWKLFGGEEKETEKDVKEVVPEELMETPRGPKVIENALGNELNHSLFKVLLDSNFSTGEMRFDNSRPLPKSDKFMRKESLNDVEKGWRLGLTWYKSALKDKMKKISKERKPTQPQHNPQ
eukprot:TRINITY_DN372_c0_g1_i4.p1 TRINITY_DN372_c0_g1~~TRINITY_DN372_c0_g1_i4.p1  ORF type:complete len:255 (-),score=98.87 TRINITY_DN372_c0_g1_i4:39-803(-)